MLESPLQSVCTHRVKGQLIFCFGFKQKRTAGQLFGTLKQGINAVHHGLRRTEVSGQIIMPAFGVTPGFQIGVYIGVAEAVNGLLRVTNKKNAGARVRLR